LADKVSALPNIEHMERRHRTDIQALRGFAVLIVVAYHARLGLIKGGYLGVDVFFVISGFLITKLIATALTDGSFSFYAFYYRRAKRLLPAAYVTFFVVAALAPVFLTQIELNEFKRQLMASLLLAGNIELWQQTGYFDGAAEAKPLLHVWSLAIEEQFYMVLPAALFLCPRRAWFPGAVLVCAVSLSLCIILAPLKPHATFYLLPTRAWELALGSAGALAVIGPATHRFCSSLYWPAIAALLLVPVFPFGGTHPGVDAIVVCTATLVVILGRHAFLEQTSIARCLARVGDFSYSLYLVHWPIIAFLNNAWVGEIPSYVRFASLLLAFLVGYLLYYSIERPIRRIDLIVRPGALAIGAAMLTAVVMAPLMSTTSGRSGADFAYIRRGNFGLDAACEFGSRFNPRQECRNSNEPRVLVWGDSFAMHLVPGLAKSNVHLVQATMSDCGPLLGMAPGPPAHSRDRAKRCIDFNESVLEYLAQSPSVEVIVLASPFWRYLSASAGRILVREADGFVEREGGVELAVSGLRNTIDAVRKLGRRVVIVAPPPSGGFDIGRCLERLASGKILLGAFADCKIPRAVHERLNKDVIAFLKRAAQAAEVEVIWFENYLCDRVSCSTLMEGTMVYRDIAHLSYEGSELLAVMMRLPELLEKTAR
jgi:peptidoglycan/LPS O-acetylase OafA/YrhL